MQDESDSVIDVVAIDRYGNETTYDFDAVILATVDMLIMKKYSKKAKS